MKKIKFTIPDSVISQINFIPPESLLSHGVIKLANDEKSYVCPECGNGEGEHGTGLIPKLMGGVWKWHCFKCDKSFNNITILSIFYGLDSRSNFVEVCKRACNDFGIYLEENKTVEKEKKLTKAELIKSDILDAQANIENLPIEVRRSLTLETYEIHKCGYAPALLTVESRLAGVKSATPTPRIIVPTGLTHYLARLTVPIETFDDAPDRAYIKEKPHIGTKLPFATEFISEQTQMIFVVEGPFDAMSLNQIFGYTMRNAIATFGAAVGKDMINKILETLDRCFADKDKKPYILILFDNDKAGKLNAPKLCREFIQHGYPAVVDFYSDSSEKVDANSILDKPDGETALRLATIEIIQRNREEWQNVIQKINDKQLDDVLNPAALFLTPEDYKKYFKDNNELSDLKTADRFAEILKQQLSDPIRYLSDVDRWASFDERTGTWIINPNANNTALTPHVKKAAAILAANAKTDHDKKIAAAYSNSRRFSPSVYFLKFNELITISTKDLDIYPNLLNVENGVIDLQTGNFYQHSPVVYHNGQPAYFSQMARAEWRGLEYRCELIEKTLAEILPDEDDRHAFLMWMAYSFTGESNEEKFLFMDGDGGNGKGTLTKVWLYIANSYGCSFPVEAVALSNKFDANSPTPALTMLEKARAAISEEIPQGMPLNQAKIKQLTGGDPIPVMPKFQEYHIIENPTHTLILSGNFLPDLNNAKDAGIIRRLRRIIFSQNFRDNPNLQLKQQLLTSDSRAAWLSLIVRHAIEWYKNGLPTSANMQKAADEYFKSQDFISSFIDDFCTLGHNLFIPRKQFLRRIREEYSKETRGLSDQSLTRMIEKVDGIIYARKEHGYSFCGVGWIDSPEQYTLGDDFYSPSDM